MDVDVGADCADVLDVAGTRPECEPIQNVNGAIQFCVPAGIRHEPRLIK